jgi:hypothetical protein
MGIAQIERLGGMSAGIEMASTEGGTPYIDFKNDPVDYDMRMILMDDNTLAINSNNSGYADLASNDHGIFARGNEYGGYFADSDGSASAHVGYGDRGIEARGNEMGGFFSDVDHGGLAKVGFGSIGIYGQGAYGVFGSGTDAGAMFQDSTTPGWGVAYLGHADLGIFAEGLLAGGYFWEVVGSGSAYIAHLDAGIWAWGSDRGGRFEDNDDGSWSNVAAAGAGVLSNGPYEEVGYAADGPSDQVVGYSAPTGNEVATYTRGTARLKEGTARIALDETFGWLTNPDIGLTAQVTPRDASILYVDSLTSEELIVRSAPGFLDDVVFDYVVYGLRLGFEEKPIVYSSETRAYLPRTDQWLAEYDRDPSLRRYSAIERFRQMAGAARGVDPESIDLSRSRELVARIPRFDPAIDGKKSHVPEHPDGVAVGGEAVQGRVADEAGTTEDTIVASSIGPTAQPGITAATTGPGPNDPGTAEIDDPDPADATWLPVAEPVEAGDVLAIDPSQASLLRRAASMADANVVGIAAGSSRETADGGLEAPMVDALYGVVKVDAGYGAIRAGDLLVTSPTAGYAMRTLEAIPGTILGKALEPMDTGTGMIRVLVMMR